MTPPELAEFQNENEKVNENEFSLVPTSPFLIPYAANAKAVPLTVVVAVDIGIAVVQYAAPSVVRIDLCTTPPGTVVANVVV